MPPLTVVKAHDVTEEFNPGLGVRNKDPTLQRCPETLHRGIIPTITDTAHADGHGASHQSLLVIKAGVLAAAI